MATILTRAANGSPLTNDEVDANFVNLNDDKIEATDLSVSTGAASGGGSLSYAAGVFTFAPADLDSVAFDISEFTTTDLAEGSNLYYTNERVDDRVNALIVAGLGVTTAYDDTAGTLTIDSDTIEELCKNGTGSTILKGTPVYQTGTAGNAMVIAPADASSSSTMPAVGVLSEDLAAEAEGSLILMGRISGVDTSAFSEGDIIYVASGGGYTNTRPTGQSVLVQNLGRVTKVHASNGGGVVMGAGRANDVPNLTDGYVFIGNAGNSYDKRALVAADISDLTATASEINTLDGITATTAELNYTDGVTSNIQAQLDGKEPSDATILKDADIGVTVQAYDAAITTATNTQTLSNKTLNAVILNNGYTEEASTLSGTAFDVSNGTLQVKVLGANTTFTDSLSSGQSMILMLENGSTYSVTWPTITWVTSTGNVAPTLTSKDSFILWKISTTLYGAYVGGYA